MQPNVLKTLISETAAFINAKVCKLLLKYIIRKSDYFELQSDSNFFQVVFTKLHTPFSLNYHVKI